MPTSETTDPSYAEADRRSERAKASLRSRVDALKHKLEDTRQKLDVAAHIANHPLPAVGIAFALGALAGLAGSRRSAPGQPGARSLTGAALGLLAALGLRLAREVAMGQLRQAAEQWWLRHDRGAPGDRPTSRATGAERMKH